MLKLNNPKLIQREVKITFLSNSKGEYQRCRRRLRRRRCAAVLGTVNGGIATEVADCTRRILGCLRNFRGFCPVGCAGSCRRLMLLSAEIASISKIDPI
jgi:hypothetical protein